MTGYFNVNNNQISKELLVNTFTGLGRAFFVSPTVPLWRRRVVVITTTQLHSTKPELKLCAGSNPAHGVSEIRDGEDL